MKRKNRDDSGKVRTICRFAAFESGDSWEKIENANPWLKTEVSKNSQNWGFDIIELVAFRNTYLWAGSGRDFFFFGFSLKNASFGLYFSFH